MVKNMIIATLYNWVRRTYTTYAPPLYPPRKDKRTEMKRLERRRKLANDEEEDEAEDDDTEDEMTVEETHHEEVAPEEASMKNNEEGARAATSALQTITAPPTSPTTTGQKIKSVGSVESGTPVTGRELVLARRRRVMETLDSVLALQTL
jgi:hypothetical protein